MKALVQTVLIPILNVVNLLFVELYSNLCVSLNKSDNVLIKALTGFKCCILLTNSFSLEAVAICRPTRRIVVLSS